MAKLQRFLKLKDSFDSQIFTFLVPFMITNEQSTDTFKKDFVYGHHRWTAIFVRSGLHVGTHLKLQTASQGMVVQLDYSFTLLNREHYTRNETYIEKGCRFTHETSLHGRKTFIALNDMIERDFMQEMGDFLIELEVRNISSVFECILRLPKVSQSRYAVGAKLESTYFCFGMFDWSISLFATEGTMEHEEGTSFQLQRHTSFDHLCNVHYNIEIGEGTVVESEQLEQLISLAGNGEPYTVGTSLLKLSKGKGSIKLKICMISVVSISEVSIYPLDKARNKSHCYDRDKQAWMLQSDISGKYLTFKLYYTDVTHVPRKYTRFVSWNIVMLTDRAPKTSVRMVYGPYSKYFVQQDLDEGYIFTTDVAVKELGDPNCPFTDTEDQRITAHIEWVDSHLLSGPIYHAHDDVDKLHKHQMWRELLALQSENLALEKQLHSYQQSIAKANHMKSQEKNATNPPDKERHVQSPRQRRQQNMQ
ncbi:hypothetical protein CHS0354_039879 [Potamilus streckersoni]|uniref:Uncharacterized protein n=1 Tax=Potamilus streckersoni TaxID=2493646 RepID=A0AAE0VX74_9BIVA|nr:hypothetical protein CHS0354_039879 [Potamilus streckersoni]